MSSTRAITSTRLELEDLWRHRLREARLRYEVARNAFNNTFGEHLEEELTADPTVAIRKARKAESDALAEYMRVLHIFTDLVLHGKLPEQQAQPERPTDGTAVVATPPRRGSASRTQRN